MAEPITPPGLMGISRRDLVLPVALMSVIGLMIIPLPPLLLDVLLSFNIALAIVVTLTAVQVKRTLDFSIFPSLLLVTTLFRLGLNVSTTRLILIDGSSGTQAAGEIIRTFGEFVVGGSYVVGIVIFLILTLINFVVITRGSGRIAEVSARFTLDALPGKQMSIDSDLSAGLITGDEARRRREAVARETDFYGAMDGASKFVRGDAIAGLIITTINIIGGLVIGIVQMDMSAAEAAQTYTVLTIGDGLVAQIPTLLVSTAAGVVVTRAADASDLGRQIVRQLFQNPQVLLAGGLVVALISLVPGMPKIVFWPLAATLVWLARRATFAQAGLDGRDPDEDQETPSGPSEEQQLSQMLPMHPLELQLGYGLVGLVSKDGGGELVDRINALRREFVQDLGLILPAMHIRDNLELTAGGYRLQIHGVEAGAGEVMGDRLMAMDPGTVREPIDGIAGTDPTFGMEVLWIRKADRARAELAGYTVVEPSAVVLTHVSDVLHRESHTLLGRAEMETLLEVLAQHNPKVVEELIPTVLSHAEVLTVLRGLLKEQVPIRNLGGIFEALAEAARFGKGLPFLVDQVRLRLGTAISQSLCDDAGTLHAALFDAPSEDQLRRLVVRNEHDVTLAPDLPTAEQVLGQLRQAVSHLHQQGHAGVIVVAQDLRYPLWRFASRFLPQLSILGNSELPPRLRLTSAIELSLGRAPTQPTTA